MAKLHMLKSLTDTINTSFILESGETLLVLDGGFASEAPGMYDYLKSLGGHVTGWFLTHLHDDHVGCFMTTLREHPDITVDAVYYNFPSDAFAVAAEPNQGGTTMQEMLDTMRSAIADRHVQNVTVQTGEVYTFDGGEVTVRILRTPDESITKDPINNSSSVYRFEVNGKSLLFLGDLGVEGGLQLLDTTDLSLLRADYLQMAHHGQNGVSREVYETIRPRFCLWCAPSWLWDNYGPGGKDTGPYNTVVTRGWISAMHCVEHHYLLTEAPHVIEL